MRISIDEVMMEIAVSISKRSTCSRRQVGCILTNELNHVIATGYNGVPRGLPHCIDTPCEGATSSSGTDLDKCQAVHGEQNAILQCRDTEAIYTAYCTTQPCITCIKLLLNTGCKRIVYKESYPHEQALILWIKSGRTITQLNSDNS